MNTIELFTFLTDELLNLPVSKYELSYQPGSMILAAAAAAAAPLKIHPEARDELVSGCGEEEEKYRVINTRVRKLRGVNSHDSHATPEVFR